ncbi:hypothetical protein J2128_001659 [Methanomicrobium sp. W14]|uniref:hypothetical protein n=1 Tax=Methanomicrobium sp. W14 TaxID=2817839 RepID=UPI001AE8F95C|nr:hypothetical protein [Methanomicrobium sp. W14]MBP2133705.1 hypothetical protein [Methanomicrobium sp. W14]
MNFLKIPVKKDNIFVRFQVQPKLRENIFSKSAINYISVKLLLVRSMKVVLLFLVAMLVLPASAISFEGINTSSLDIPEINEANFTENPLGTLESLEAYAEHLISAADEILKFIESIFDMLGIANDENVTNLMNILNESANISVDK